MSACAKDSRRVAGFLCGVQGGRNWSKSRTSLSVLSARFSLFYPPCCTPSGGIPPSRGERGGGPAKLVEVGTSLWPFSMLTIEVMLRPEPSLPGRGGRGRQPIYIRTIASLVDLRGRRPPHVGREEIMLFDKTLPAVGGQLGDIPVAAVGTYVEVGGKLRVVLLVGSFLSGEG